MKRLVLFASGSGSNVENIANYFANHSNIEISAVCTNNPKAGVITRCKNLNLPLFYFSKAAFNSPQMLNVLQALQPNLIILAGFLWKVTKPLVLAYPKQIINIHPALLPKYGGKGMFGMHVHHAVFEANEPTTGITIHYVNEAYDEGAIIFQKKVHLNNVDTATSIAQKVHQLEYENYPVIIEKLLKNA